MAIKDYVTGYPQRSKYIFKSIYAKTIEDVDKAWAKLVGGALIGVISLVGALLPSAVFGSKALNQVADPVEPYNQGGSPLVPERANPEYGPVNSVNSDYEDPFAGGEGDAVYEPPGDNTPATSQQLYDVNTGALFQDQGGYPGGEENQYQSPFPAAGIPDEEIYEAVAGIEGKHALDERVYNLRDKEAAGGDFKRPPGLKGGALSGLSANDKVWDKFCNSLKFTLPEAARIDLLNDEDVTSYVHENYEKLLSVGITDAPVSNYIMAMHMALAHIEVRHEDKDNAKQAIFAFVKGEGTDPEGVQNFRAMMNAVAPNLERDINNAEVELKKFTNAYGRMRQNQGPFFDSIKKARSIKFDGKDFSYYCMEQELSQVVKSLAENPAITTISVKVGAKIEKGGALQDLQGGVARAYIKQLGEACQNASDPNKVIKFTSEDIVFELSAQQMIEVAKHAQNNLGSSETLTDFMKRMQEVGFNPTQFQTEVTGEAKADSIENILADMQNFQTKLKSDSASNDLVEVASVAAALAGRVKQIPTLGNVDYDTALADDLKAEAERLQGDIEAVMGDTAAEEVQKESLQAMDIGARIDGIVDGLVEQLQEAADKAAIEAAAAAETEAVEAPTTAGPAEKELSLSDSISSSISDAVDLSTKDGVGVARAGSDKTISIESEGLDDDAKSYFINEVINGVVKGAQAQASKVGEDFDKDGIFKDNFPAKTSIKIGEEVGLFNTEDLIALRVNNVDTSNVRSLDQLTTKISHNIANPQPSPDSPIKLGGQLIERMVGHARKIVDEALKATKPDDPAIAENINKANVEMTTPDSDVAPRPGFVPDS